MFKPCNIKKAAALKEALRNGPYAFPGGYPIYFIAGDCEALSFEAVRDNYRLCLFHTLAPEYGKDWQIVTVDINWENQDLHCGHTGKPIESAYADVSDQ